MDINGHEMPLADLAGKVTVIVNVASQCGYTDANYKGLQTAYAKYQDFGLEILAFPCNQARRRPCPALPRQTPALPSPFATERYAATFPLMAKVDVNGEHQHPVFAWLKANAPAPPGRQQGGDLAWNFEKFLVDKGGRAIKRYGSGAQQQETNFDLHHLALFSSPPSPPPPPLPPSLQT
ncbi:hypothetical protein CHLNCDRAFT_20756 [Chlorella variabilis]|uniref:Glutathione peroxidase n=1 Tax=Chlorella variabilis TaxID=554065 RepID=E1Z7K5_CHLVA|nr:hypothetical protein CHLNCDRAFT_20756 [Chlorella variabilis]EFN58186.1 hypothetical protein CHLNCDRAFT_20756 [Chlorella variabilis]|eukprot:XP_005850288.1 hypothetical protein CHLNCDRAFT_20756 [Chlorella variabilis]